MEITERSIESAVPPSTQAFARHEVAGRIKEHNRRTVRDNSNTRLVPWATVAAQRRPDILTGDLVHVNPTGALLATDRIAASLRTGPTAPKR